MGGNVCQKNSQACSIPMRSPVHKERNFEITISIMSFEGQPPNSAFHHGLGGSASSSSPAR